MARTGIVSSGPVLIAACLAMAPLGSPMARLRGKARSLALPGLGLLVLCLFSCRVPDVERPTQPRSMAVHPRPPRHQVPIPRTSLPAETQGKLDKRSDFRTEYLTLGLEAGIGVGLFAEVGSLFWRHFMIVPLRIHGAYHYSPVPVPALRVGALLGCGGAHGHRRRFSHWFVTGSELILAQGTLPWGKGMTRFWGWLLPLGYELRYRFITRGQRHRSIGIRLLVAIIPVSRVRYREGYCAPFDFLCTEEAPRFTWPLTMGISLFYGFGI